MLRKISTLTLAELRARPELAELLVLKKATAFPSRPWSCATGKPG